MSRDWIVVLGASSGFGAAAARAFAARGYGVVGVHLDRRAAMPAVEALVAELKGHDVPVRFHNVNAAGDEERAKVLEQLEADLGEGDRVRVLLHSLAFGTLRPLVAPDDGAVLGSDRPRSSASEPDSRATGGASATLGSDRPRSTAAEPDFSAPGGARATLGRKHVEMTLDVMSSSLVYWAQDLVSRGHLRAGGRIFAMTSSGSLAAWPSYGAVSAAKSALEAWIRQLAVELAPRGITANAIMAGVTRTAALEKIPGAEELARRALERNPSGRLTVPEDVAACLVALSEPGTGWMTGNVLRVDGGESVSG